jgi:hypothetical protein
MINADLEGFKTPSRNIYFENGVLYSYGSHYPMAAKYQRGVGSAYREIILINSTKSSVTTQKHKSQLNHSTKLTQRVFHVPMVAYPDHLMNIEHLEEKVYEAISGVLSCRVNWTLGDVQGALGRLNSYAKYFGTKTMSIPDDLMEVLEELNHQNHVKTMARMVRREAKAIEALELRRIKYAEEVSKWFKNEETMYIPRDMFNFGHDVIRIKDDTVETQRGAEVPMDTARHYFDKLKKGILKIGDKVGPFEVESIDNAFIQIGCHKFKIAQLAEVLA